MQMDAVGSQVGTILFLVPLGLRDLTFDTAFVPG